MAVSGDAKHVSVSISVGVLKANHTLVQVVMNNVGNVASKIIDNGTAITNASAAWFKDVQQNWLSYMIIGAIIAESIAFLHYTFLFHCNRMKSSATQGQLIELTKTIGSKIIPMLQPLPLSTISPSNLSYLAQNSQI